MTEQRSRAAWLPDEETRLIAAVRDGATNAKAGAMFGRSEKAIVGKLREMRRRGMIPLIGTRPGPARPLPSDDDLRQMRADLMSVVDIAKQYRVSEPRISGRLIELGLPRRLPSQAYARCGERETIWTGIAGNPPGWLISEAAVTEAHLRIGPYQAARVRTTRGPVLRGNPYSVADRSRSSGQMCVEAAV